MNKIRKYLTYDVISKNRDILMGIAIISILFFYFVEECRIYEYNYSYFVRMFDRYIGSSSVDSFLFFSGFGLYYAFKRNNTLKKFYKKRLIKVLIPYLVIAMPAWYWRDVIYSGKDFVVYLRDLFFVTFFEGKTTWYWYIIMIVICYLIFPYVYEIAETSNDKITDHMRMSSIFCFITTIAILFSLYYKEFFNDINIALLRFPAFFGGCFIGKASYEKKEISISAIVMLLLSILFLKFRESNNIIINRYVLAYFNISMSILFAICIELLMSKGIKFKLIKKILKWFGIYSLELYLTHVTIRGIMNMLGYHTCRIRYELLMIVLGIIASIALKKIAGDIIGYLMKNEEVK